VGKTVFHATRERGRCPLRSFSAEWYPSYSASKTGSLPSVAVFHLTIGTESAPSPWAIMDPTLVPSPGIEPKSADVAQLVEQLIRNQQVIGSSPIVGSIPFRIKHRKGPKEQFHNIS
jgi:hypothetical protein